MKKFPALLLAVLLPAVAFLGCSGGGLQKVVVNEVTRSVFYAPFYVAVEKGFFAQEGLDVEIVTGGGSDKSMTALLADQADAILAGPETDVYVVNEGRGDHPIIVAQLTKRDGSFLVSRSADDAFDWSSLRGKSIIGGRKGGMPLMTLEYVLKQHGLTPGKDVTVYDHIQFNLMGGAFEGGLGDYVTLFEPTASLFESEGKGAVVANVGLASGEVPYTAFMVTQSRIAEDPEFVSAFVRAIYRGQQWVQSAADAEIAEAMAPYFPDADKAMLESVAKSYRETDSWCSDPIMTEDAYNRLLDVMDSAGELAARPEMAKLVDNSFAESALLAK